LKISFVTIYFPITQFLAVVSFAFGFSKNLSTFNAFQSELEDSIIQYSETSSSFTGIVAITLEFFLS